MFSGGDARILLNILEACVIQEMDKDEVIISKKLLKMFLQRKNILYDKDGEEHYNLIPLLLKVFAAATPMPPFYWMARMLEGGEDPLFIARRLVVLAPKILEMLRRRTCIS